MSANLFDLGARMRAAAERRPVPSAAYAPALPPNNAVAVTIEVDDNQLLLTATDGTMVESARGPRSLEALDRLGVGLTEVHRTLVVTDERTMSLLASMCRDQPRAASAPVIAWWDQRADHPGSGAVMLATEAARRRWTLGTSPAAEREVHTWLDWLSITAPLPGALLDLARAITAAGHTLPGLLDLAEGDTRSWDYHRKRIDQGRDWRATDTRTEAALGLATRSDAADLYDSLRLGDQLVALGASFTGTVVPGVVQHAGDGGLVVEAVRPLSRLRVGAEVQGWAGGPTDVVKDDHLLRSGVVSAAHVDTAGRLTLRVSDAVTRPAPFAVGSQVCLRPKAVEPVQQMRGRRQIKHRYRSDGNWLAGRGRPTPLRTDVPLDVVLAAADDA
jgi:hypothetical protein